MSYPPIRSIPVYIQYQPPSAEAKTCYQPILASSQNARQASNKRFSPYPKQRVPATATHSCQGEYDNTLPEILPAWIWRPKKRKTKAAIPFQSRRISSQAKSSSFPSWESLPLTMIGLINTLTRTILATLRSDRDPDIDSKAEKIMTKLADLDLALEEKIEIAMHITVLNKMLHPQCTLTGLQLLNLGREESFNFQKSVSTCGDIQDQVK